MEDEEYSTERIKAEMNEAWWNAQAYGVPAGIFGLLAVSYTFMSFDTDSSLGSSDVGFLLTLWVIAGVCYYAMSGAENEYKKWKSRL